jgi:hypothetical protein
MALRQGASNKSPGWDGISLGFCKTYSGVIKDDLLPLYNQMFQEAKITAVQKTGLVMCLPMKESSIEAGEYRPITLLNTDYKLLARILANRTRRTPRLILWGARQNNH